MCRMWVPFFFPVAQLSRVKRTRLLLVLLKTWEYVLGVCIPCLFRS